MVIIRVQAKHLAGEAYVKVHLDGIIAALWLAAIVGRL